VYIYGGNFNNLSLIALTLRGIYRCIDEEIWSTRQVVLGLINIISRILSLSLEFVCVSNYL
jgi:hypothetical protein